VPVTHSSSATLRSCLDYEPRVLRFGTSGRRGKVSDLTQLEVYINALAELEYLQSLAVSEGGIRRGDAFYFARDLRPSSTEYVEAEQGRGEIVQALVAAMEVAGMQPVNLGRIPTPALTAYALGRGKGSMMATGSHIPFDRNGYKTNSSTGELLKHQEEPINRKVEEIRQRTYGEPYEASLFDVTGRFKQGHRELPEESDAAERAYRERYRSFFQGSLSGTRVLVYQHSAVGRDLLVKLLMEMGAEVVAAGRSETFVPIDTENIDDVQLAVMQALADEATRQTGRSFDALVSTDGDSDRPLVLGVEKESGRLRFFGGDLVGMIVGEYLGADAVVVPISCSDAIDRGSLAPVVEPKTRIGSPYVIAGMQEARRRGKRTVCGWEANGGFLTGSDIECEGRVLPALATRDAMLPILAVLFAAQESKRSLNELFHRLPRRLSRAALLPDFSRSVATEMLARYLPPRGQVADVRFSDAGEARAWDALGQAVPLNSGQVRQLEGLREDLQTYFTADAGFPGIVALNYIDGLRITFANGDVAHLRPSGNADELRIYAVADSQERANAIAKAGVAEPDGILRRMERAATTAGRN
jgi:phosphomannomutase